MALRTFFKYSAIACIFLLPGFLSSIGKAQDAYYGIHITKSLSEIKLDGHLTEPAWQTADVAADFYQQFPYDTSYSKTKTEVRVTYDDQYLYVGAKCWDPNPGDYIVQSLKRDFSYPVTDAFAVFIDPFSDKTNGFSFAVSPLGVQREGLLENGGSFGVSTQWDNRWFSAVQEYEDRWEVEMAIPFKTLRYKENLTTWRINFSRNNLKENENSSWVPVPRNFNIATLAFTGELIWDTPSNKAGTNISVIPYALGRYQADYENGTETLEPNAGLDAKVAVTSALNLDLTINPDFSQVEVDRQVTNLSRFSLFFPERRQFFIENSDLFGQFGFRAIRPFFSRRIGLFEGSAVPILAGARLSGKLNPKWRIGLMSMQTEGIGELDLRSQNYSVAVLQRQVLARSNIGAIFVNRQGFDGDNRPDGGDYNRVAGLEFNFASKDNRFRGETWYHRSWDPNTTRNKTANAGWFMFNNQYMTLMYNHEWVDENYNAEVGFVPRLGYFRLEPVANFRIFPKKGPILNHGPELYASWYWDNLSWRSIERQSRAGYAVQFQNRSRASVNAESWHIYLRNDFDPTRTGATPLPDSTSYDWWRVNASYDSDFRKKFSFGVDGSYGGFFAGTRLSAGLDLSYRAQPWGIFSLSFDQNYITTPDTTVNLLLISPRFEFSFTRSVFFTTFFQFNTQTQNFNINARLQWRFKPMSDLFLVLTDNYLTENFGVRNRAVVLKLNYWFTL